MRFKKITERRYRRLKWWEEFLEDAKKKPFRALGLIAAVSVAVIGFVGIFFAGGQ